MRRAARTDGPESSIVAVLRGIGAVVWPAHGVDGWGDLMVVYHGRVAVLEIKADHGKQSPLQKRRQEAWVAAGGEWVVVRTADDALRLFGVEVMG